MCRQYAVTAEQHLMRDFFGVDAELDFLGNFAPLRSIWPKHEAPVVRINAEGQRELVRMHWVFNTTGFKEDRESHQTGSLAECA